MADVTAAPFPLKLGKETFMMSPLDDVDSEEINNWLRSSVIETAVRGIPKDASKELRQEIIDAAISQARRLNWNDENGSEIMASLDGVTRVLWQGIQKNHPDLSFEEFRRKLFDPNYMEMSLAVWKELNLQGLERMNGEGDGAPGKKKRRKKRRRKKKSTRA